MTRVHPPRRLPSAAHAPPGSLIRDLAPAEEIDSDFGPFTVRLPDGSGWHVTGSDDIHQRGSHRRPLRPRHPEQVLVVHPCCSRHATRLRHDTDAFGPAPDWSYERFACATEEVPW